MAASAQSAIPSVSCVSAPACWKCEAVQYSTCRQLDGVWGSCFVSFPGSTCSRDWVSSFLRVYPVSHRCRWYVTYPYYQRDVQRHERCELCGLGVLAAVCPRVWGLSCLGATISLAWFASYSFTLPSIPSTCKPGQTNRMAVLSLANR